MAKGHTHKKIKTSRKIKRARLDHHYKLRSDAAHVHTTAFLGCSEIVLYHFLEACTLATLITLSHTSVFFRTMVKTLYRIRLLAVIEPFVGHQHVEAFFNVLEASDSAIGGSTLPRVLAPPVDEEDDWMPSNLNIYVPYGGLKAWKTFFARICLEPSSSQPGIARPYKMVTNEHLVYESCLLVSLSIHEYLLWLTDIPRATR